MSLRSTTPNLERRISPLLVACAASQGETDRSQERIPELRCTDGHADFWRSGKLSRSMQRVQILGGAGGDLAATARAMRWRFADTVRTRVGTFPRLIALAS